jgi:hypothetical protein
MSNKPKLTIIHADGTTVDVEPLQAWDPAEIEQGHGTLLHEMDWCKVRGYIARASNPQTKYWKNTVGFRLLPHTLPADDRDALDWQHFDPEADENPLLA